MIDFDLMTLEELQPFLKVNTGDPEDVKRAQRLSGLTGKAVDGIWGPQTSNAWDKFWKENKSKIRQAASDERQYQNAIARGQNNPMVEDLVGFSNQRDEQQQARNVNISKLEQQIDMVKERIARNKRALVDMKGVTDRISSLEFKKINSTDPSTIWRWNVGQQDMKEANEQVKQGSANKYSNEVEALLNKSIPDNSGEQTQLLDQLRDKIAEGKTLGQDVSSLEKRVDELTKEDRTVKEVKSVMNYLDTQLRNGTISNADYIEGIKDLLKKDFHNFDLRLLLESKSSLGEKKISSGKKATQKDKARKDKEKDFGF